MQSLSEQTSVVVAHEEVSYMLMLADKRGVMEWWSSKSLVCQPISLCLLHSGKVSELQVQIGGSKQEFFKTFPPLAESSWYIAAENEPCLWASPMSFSNPNQQAGKVQ